MRCVQMYQITLLTLSYQYYSRMLPWKSRMITWNHDHHYKVNELTYVDYNLNIKPCFFLNIQIDRHWQTEQTQIRVCIVCQSVESLFRHRKVVKFIYHYFICTFSAKFTRTQKALAACILAKKSLLLKVCTLKGKNVLTSGANTFFLEKPFFRRVCVGGGGRGGKGGGGGGWDKQFWQGCLP